MRSYVLAIDQGTTSSRAIVFDDKLHAVAVAQEEFTQHFPRPGFVEHDAEEIWDTVLSTSRNAIGKAGISAAAIAAIGITNQRETTLIWERDTGRPIHRAIVWQDRRTADRCQTLKSAGYEPGITAKTGLLLDPYFSGTKAAWMLDMVPGARERAARGELCFGTVDSFLISRLTGGKVHATDATNASRTLLLDIHSGRFDDELLSIFRCAASHAAGGQGLCRALRHDRARAVRRLDRDSRRCRRPAGGDHRSGLLRARHAEIDLRHRLLRAAQYRAAERHLAQPASHHHRLSAGRRAHLRARGLDLRRRRRRAVAARRAQDHSRCRRHGAAGRRRRSRTGGLSRAGLCRPWARHGGTPRRAASITGLTRGTGTAELARAALEAVCYQTRDLLEAMRGDWRAAAPPERCSGSMAAWSPPTGRCSSSPTSSMRPSTGRRCWRRRRSAPPISPGSMPGSIRAPAEFAKGWKLERRFTPKMDEATRGRKFAGWRDAVSRALSRGK